ncbi:V-type proton ATPase subunit e [Beauveria bassiana]|uniref:V-type proton ATPase subunit e n=1 Tax=Beauveria bassiana TaxID=176275 RepID=A0A2N6NVQ0_BEABA|nr:V-type proton ATPase subunit e [Beauveria bassiana]PMB71336.1 V-type proton ATPase subunit e [Beauveria bassiana]
MAQGYSVFIGLFVIVAMCTAAWLLAPKGENRVYVENPPPSIRQPPANARFRLWRSSLILAIVSCYLMWAITFLAQLHPLIRPKRHDLREQFLEH